MSEDATMIEVTNFFGRCPVCGGNNGHINTGRSHWFWFLYKGAQECWWAGRLFSL